MILCQHKGFVSGLIREAVLLHMKWKAGRRCVISSGEYGRTTVGLRCPVKKPGDHRGLACSSPGNISYGNAGQ
jgi:hypothetical protein